MANWKGILGGAVACLIATACILVASPATVNAAPHNSWATAKRECAKGNRTIVKTIKKKNLSIEGKDRSVDSRLGTLYLIRTTHGKHGKQFCAITLKGVKTKGKYHHMEGGIESEPIPIVGGYRYNVMSGHGNRKAKLGPLYVSISCRETYSAIKIAERFRWAKIEC